MSPQNPSGSKLLPSREELRILLDYDAATGKLWWKARPPSMFDGLNWERCAASWNTRFAGKEAFTTAGANGHRYSSIHAVKLLAHRVIWKMVFGDDPLEIDHINGDPADNRLTNLRNVTHRENGRNVKLSRNSLSGRIGVYRHVCGKWCARIQVDGETKYLGLFTTLEAASAARLAAERRFGFHPNHGRKMQAAA